jgi:hypothetical protein
MQAKGFFGSLFDYSFSSYITPRLIKVLYVLMTISAALWTLLVILLAFKASSALGILTLLIGGPIFFVITMIYARVGLELVMAFFHIHGDVDEINRRGGGTGDSRMASADAAEPAPAAAPADVSPSSPEPAPSAPPTEARFCDNCGTERSPGKRFCTGCGEALA